MNQYDVVEIIEIIKVLEFHPDDFNQRLPIIGDVATIIEIYKHEPLAYELECCDELGVTIWLQTIAPKDIILKKVV
jgi:hypothetical protein